jgi:hypothetical protein
MQITLERILSIFRTILRAIVRTKITTTGFFIMLQSVIAMSNPDLALSAAAKVVSLSGKVTMDTKAAKDILLQANADVPEGATVKTGPTAVAKLLFTDDTIMDIGAESKFSVDEYSSGGGEERSGVFSLAYGTLRSLVSKPVKKGNYKVKTRDAIMGVRGTEFVVSAPFVAPGTAPASAPPSTVLVASGTVAVSAAPSAGGASGFAANSPIVSVSAGQAFSTAQLPTAPAAGGRASGGVSAANATGSTSAGAPSSAPSSQPTTVSSNQMAAAMGEARISDNTLVKTITVKGALSDASTGSGGSSKDGAKSEGSTTATAAGTQSSGGMITASVMGAMADALSSGSTTTTVDMGTTDIVPTGVSVDDVITAPPVLQIPGQLRNITIIIQ